MTVLGEFGGCAPDVRQLTGCMTSCLLDCSKAKSGVCPQYPIYLWIYFGWCAWVCV